MNQEKGSSTAAASSGEATKVAATSNCFMTPEFRKLYRTCVECVKRLDQSTKDKNSVSEVFQPETIAVATRLRCCCEKIMHDCPVDICRQAEDLVWKKCFYEPIQHVRKCKKINALPAEYETTYAMLLSSAIGYYNCLLAKLQLQCHIDLEHVVDFPFIQRDSSRTNAGETFAESAKGQWATDAAHRILIYMGDIARYQYEFDKSAGVSCAQHYYHLALALKPYHGTPFNQLGTLFAGRNHGLDSAYYYYRCVCSEENFEGSCSNLNQLLNENAKIIPLLMSAEGSNNLKSQSEYKLFLLMYLYVFQIFHRDEEIHDQGTSLQDICQKTIGLFEICLRHSLLKKKTAAGKNRHDSFDAVLLLKIVVMQMLVIKKLADSASLKLSAAIAWLLSVFSNLLTCSTDFLNGDLFLKPQPVTNGFTSETNEVLPLEDKADATEHAQKVNGSIEKSADEEGAVMRRRRHGSEGSDDEWQIPKNSYSDEEDDEEENRSSCSDVSTSNGNVLLNEMKSVCGDEVEERSAATDSPDTCFNNCLTMSSQDMERGSSDNFRNQPFLSDFLENGASVDSDHSCCGQPKSYVQRGTPAEKLNFLVSFDWLLVMKVICSWLHCNASLILSIEQANQTSKIIWSHLAFFLNLLPNDEQLMKAINDDEELLKNLSGSVWTPLSDWYQKTPLPEDVHLRGVSPLSQTFASLDYTKPPTQSKMSQMILRICYIRSFGHYLIRLNTPEFHFDRSRMEFVACLGRTLMQNVDEDRKSELMRNMAKLKLKDDLAHVNRTYWIPVYLVPDTSALCNKLSLIKQLSTSQKFVIVIPTAVIRELDKLKKETGPAREATRWIESQFQRASKFVRIQKATETTPDFRPNFVDADEEFGTIAEIMNCCAYLSHTVTGCNNTTVATLLTNHTMGSVAFQRLSSVLAQNSAPGVVVDNIFRFFTRWQNVRKKDG